MGSERSRAAHAQLRAFVFELLMFGRSHTLAAPSFRHSVELQAVVTEHSGDSWSAAVRQTARLTGFHGPAGPVTLRVHR